MENSKWMIHKINDIALNMSFSRTRNTDRFIKRYIHILLFNFNWLPIDPHIIAWFSLTA